MPRKTTKKQEILEYLTQYIAEYGYPPSIREIATAVELKSTSTVHYHLNALQNDGQISVAEFKKRAISLPNGKQGEIPILGTVAAGKPILAFENITGYIPWHGNANCFALKVSGDSMIQAGILDGDYVIVTPQPTAQPGEIVVALLEDEATVKRFARQDGHAWLYPENPSYSPILADNATILGRVCALQRLYNR